MPLVHIFHGWPDADHRVEGLSNAVHAALVEAFGVPVADRFQTAISLAAKGALSITPEFLGMAHTAEAVVIQITCAPGRTPDQKRALYAAIAAKAQAAAGLRQEDVIVNLVETARENWSFGGGLAQLCP